MVRTKSGLGPFAIWRARKQEWAEGKMSCDAGPKRTSAGTRGAPVCCPDMARQSVLLH